MRKTITTVLAVGLIVGAFMAPSADAKKKKPKPRVVTDTYDAPAIGVSTAVASGGASGCTGGNNIGCVEFPTTAKDKYIKVEVTDQSGQPAGGYLSQGDTDGDGVGNLFGDFCGAHLAPVAITPGAPVKISLYNGTCVDGSQSTVTTGTVKATFTVK